MLEELDTVLPLSDDWLVLRWALPRKVIS